MNSFRFSRLLAAAWSGLALFRGTVPHQCGAAAPLPYENWELVNNGELVVSALEDLDCCEDDVSYPSVVEVPTWVTNKPHPHALYYLYYGEHHGFSIRMKWAPTIEGPWTPFHLGTTGGIGVLDFRNDTSRTVRQTGPENWSYVGSPEVFIDNVNQVFVLAFTGRIISEGFFLSNGSRYNYGLHSYVAFSRDGLNFNDPQTGGGQAGMWGPPGYRLSYGPLEQFFYNTTKGNLTVTTIFGPPFTRLIEIRQRLYGFHTGGQLTRPQHSTSPWHFASRRAYRSNMRLWVGQTTPDALWNSGDAELERYKTRFGAAYPYESHIATWFASLRFLSHPNNPSKMLVGGPYSVSSAPGLGKVNHVEVFSVNANTVEVFIYIRLDYIPEYPVDDPFKDLMRIEMNVTSDDWNEWSILTVDGMDVFEVTLTPEQVRAKVAAANTGGSVNVTLDPTRFADPASMGVPAIIRTVYGKYCFIGFKSLSRQPDFDFSEGQIVAIRLTGSGIVAAGP